MDEESAVKDIELQPTVRIPGDDLDQLMFDEEMMRGILASSFGNSQAVNAAMEHLISWSREFLWVVQ